MTESAYIKYLNLMRELHPESEWIPVLERGYTAANVVYMRKVVESYQLSVNSYQLTVDSCRLTVDSTDNGQPITDNRIDKKWDMLHIKLRKLGTERAELSNRYHILNTTAERRANNDRIREVQGRIASVMKEIDYYKATGTLIKDAKDEFDLPNDKYELQRRIGVLRASISRERRNLEQIIEDKLPESLELSKSLKIKKEHIKQRLEKLLKEKTYAEIKIENL
ncbi:MAG: hypothetical protein IPN68_17830 [Bacteroidetes bacterium]|nr:hypothetical protein [Bacteroidota bacterium]